MSEQLSVEVSIDDTRYNERVQFSSNSSKTFFLFTDFALGMNASLSRFALQLSNIGLADFGYTAQLAFRSAVATSIGSNFTHDAVTIESFALASSAWDADSATRRRLSTELRLTVRFQIHAETVPDFAVNISHLRAAGAEPRVRHFNQRDRRAHFLNDCQAAPCTCTHNVRLARHRARTRNCRGFARSAHGQIRRLEWL